MTRSGLVRLSKSFVRNGSISLRNLAFSALRHFILTGASVSSLDSLLPCMLRELYQSIFYESPEYEKKVELSEKRLFEIWRLFFDKETTKTLDLPSISRDFCLQFITYLEKHKTALESIQIYYNWILSRVYVSAFKNLPSLKNLTVLGYMDDAFLKIISEHCQLDSLEILDEGHSGEGLKEMRTGRSPSVISRFLKSQRSSLQRIDLIQLFASSPSKSLSSCLEDLQSMEAIASLSLDSEMFMLLTKEMNSVKELSLSLENGTGEGILFERVLIFCPNVERISLLKLSLRGSPRDGGPMICEDAFIRALRDSEVGRRLKVLSAYLFGRQDYLAFLEHTPNIEKASFELGCGSIDNIVQSHRPTIEGNNPFWSNLKSLSIRGCFYVVNFQSELQPILLHSPRLEDCNLVFHGLTSHPNEEDFLNSLKPFSLLALKSLRIRLHIKRFALPASLAFELLSRCSNLKTLENLRTAFHFSEDEVDLMLDIGAANGYQGYEYDSLIGV